MGALTSHDYSLILGPKALFSLQNFWVLDTVALLFLFDKHCPFIK